MIKILYISWTEKMSGGEISFVNYAKQLNKNIFNPVFLCPKQGRFSEKLIKAKISVKFLKLNSFSFKKPLNFLISLIRLIIFIKKEKIALIHNTTFYSNQVSVVVGKICRIPVITHGHSFATQKEIKRNLLSFADKIIACSDAIKNNIVPQVKEDNIEVLWHSIKIPELKNKSFFLHKELNLPKNCSLVGHIGLLEERKRQEDLIRAAQIVVKKNKKVKFLIIGDSQFGTKDYEIYLHNLVKKLKLEDNILFLGFRENISDLINELDIVALPSLNEPFALVMIESMALEKPFIGADSGGTSELITHMENGLLIPPKDHIALAKSILLLLENKEFAKKIGCNGRISVIKECNIEKFISKLSEIYIYLLNKKLN